MFQTWGGGRVTFILHLPFCLVNAEAVALYLGNHHLAVTVAAQLSWQGFAVRAEKS